MNEIIPQDNPFKVFDFDGTTVRIILNDVGNPLFIAADVCKALGLSNTSAALSSLDTDQKGITDDDTPYNSQEFLYVTESGLYSLIFKSKKPAAKAFQRWVTDEVIPAIRKTGGYQVKPLSPGELLVANAQAYLEHERAIAAERLKNAEQDERLDAVEARVADSTEYFTVAAFCKLKGIPFPHKTTLQSFGRACSDYSRKAGISVGKIPDQKYGYIHTYHISVLEAILLPPMIKGAK